MSEVKEAKTTLASGESISHVFCRTTSGNLYKATPEEVAAANQGMTSFTLEGSSSPVFPLSNRGAAESYIAQMGGYMMLVKDGVAKAAKLDRNDWTKFADGTAVGDASRFETMVHVPTCYYKATGKTMNFSGVTPVSNGLAFDSPQWVGAYKMYVDGSSVGHSRPGVSPSHTKTMTEFWNCAQAKGSQWGLANYGFYCLINALHQARYGDLDSQTVIGKGFQHSSWEAARNVVMGKTIALGDGSGSVLYNDATLGNQFPVKLFGFEDLWGKLWEFCPGIRFYMSGSTRIAVVYGGNLVSNDATGRTFATLSSANGDYAKAMQLGEYWDMIPKAIGGSDATYYCDGYWASSSGQLLVVGGGAYIGSRCGLSDSDSHYVFSDSYSYVGARLAFFGSPEIVSGADLVALAA